ncbi:hypothetical protein [Cupriavidus necator]|uniref:hypothetical protein n=1 Tax=Cupriavidus necator TaxID=106590 RepID=UPI0002E42AFE|nr:hypothetical protein [Cupriavidus necator]WKA42620.1 hypothetical protein QWP09_08970 [Cupriavidus necator]
MAIEYRQQMIKIKALVDDTRRTAEERLEDIAKLLEGLGRLPLIAVHDKHGQQLGGL